MHYPVLSDITTGADSCARRRRGIAAGFASPEVYELLEAEGYKSLFLHVENNIGI
jgi:hypothetical protein